MREYNKKNSNFEKIILIALSIIWMIVIFLFSNRNYYDSNKDSMGLIYQATSIISNVINIEDEEILTVIATFNKPVRKLAHMIEYFVLALLIFNFFKGYRLKTKKYYLTLLICFVYALLDEYHQSFINGRTGQLVDCFIDISGSIIYLFLVFKTNKIKINSRKRIK